MTENRSLDEFLGGGNGRDVEAESGAAEVTASAVDERDGGPGPSGDDGRSADGDVAPKDADTVEPAAPTYRWDRGGAACDRCGESAERRWADGDAFVCGDCKEW